MVTKRFVSMSPADQPPTKRLHVVGVPALQPLPEDLLLEIAARCDVVTIVRCAAVSRPIRRAILGQDFGRCLALRAAANGGFDPALLLGVSYWRQDFGSAATGAPLHVVQAPPSPSGGAGAASSRPPLHSYHDDVVDHLPGSTDLEQVASRGVLVVLQQKQQEARTALGQLCVWNSLTGRSSWLPDPPSAVHDKWYPPALLESGAGRSFELLVADMSLQTQTFSSEDGKWDAARTINWRRRPDSSPDGAANPLVVGRSAVHWLCPFRYDWRHSLSYEPHILSLDVAAALATTIELPPDALKRMRRTQRADGLLLTRSTDGRLSVLVAENRVISLWTMSEEDSPESSLQTRRRWSRQVVIHREAIDRQAGLDVCVDSIRFEGFGERSGAVLVHMTGVGLVAVLDLGSKECRVLTRWGGQTSAPSTGFSTRVSQLCLHEIDLASLLQAMRPNCDIQPFHR